MGEQGRLREALFTCLKRCFRLWGPRDGCLPLGPTSKIGATRGCSWWNTGLERDRRAVNRARERAQRERDPNRSTELQETFREKRRAYKQAIRKAKVESFREELAEATPEDPWGLAHRMMARRKKIPTTWETIQDEEGRWTTGRKSTAEVLIRKYFPADDASSDVPANAVCWSAGIRWNEEKDGKITLGELEEVIRKRPKRKAQGRDGFPAAGLRHLLEEAGEELLQVLNGCLEEGVFPRVWKEAAIAWIPKPGSGGLRPICLLPTIGKVLDKVLAARLAHHLESTGRLSDRQFGFRRGRGTTEALRRVVQGMKSAKEAGRHCLVVALDIRNAFNSAWYPKLRGLLADSGCPGDLGRAIASFLEDRRVTSQGVTVNTERGCPQGSCLGPILWLLIMEDWFRATARITHQEAVEVDVQAFADDQLIRITGPSVKRIEATWEATWDACRSWAEDHKLEYAPQKTAAIFAAARGQVREPRVRMGGVVVEPGFSM